MSVCLSGGYGAIPPQTCEPSIRPPRRIRRPVGEFIRTFYFVVIILLVVVVLYLSVHIDVYLDEVIRIFRLEYDGIEEIARSFVYAHHVVGKTVRVLFPHLFLQLFGHVLQFDNYTFLICLYVWHSLKKIFASISKICKTSTKSEFFQRKNVLCLAGPSDNDFQQVCADRNDKIRTFIVSVADIGKE